MQRNTLLVLALFAGSATMRAVDEFQERYVALAMARSLVGRDEDFSIVLQAVCNPSTGLYNVTLMRRLLTDVYDLQTAAPATKTSQASSSTGRTRSVPAQPSFSRPPAAEKVPNVVRTQESLDALSALPEFVISLKNDGPVRPERAFGALHAAIPAMGHYQNLDTKKKGKTKGDCYNFRRRLATVELDSAHLQRVPLNILLAVAKQLGAPFNVHDAITSKRCADYILQGRTVDFNVVINSTVFNHEEDSADRSYNIVFHPWLSARAGSGGMINTNVPMGIFNPDGVTGRDMPVNVLGALNVNVHTSDLPMPAFSPDNARFVVQQGRSVATFWSVAVSHDGRSVMITFHIVVDGTVGTLISEINNRTWSLGLFLQELSALRVQGADQNALAQAVRLLLELTRNN